jgi:predicted DNA-binding transcriptional regulator YafY
MSSADIKKSGILLMMYIEIVKNPEITRKELMSRLELNKSRYHRCFNDLRLLMPIDYNPITKRYELISDVKLKDVLSDPNELYVFTLMLRLFSGKLKSQSEIIGKLKQLPGMDVDVEMLYKYFVFPGENEDIEKNAGTIFYINRAILSGRKIRFSYDTAKGKIDNFVVSPYRFIYDKNWYVLGRADYNKQIRRYKISRIDHLELMEETITAPGDNIDEIAEKRINTSWDFDDCSPFEVIIEFNGLSRRHIKENTWHKTQKTEDIDNERTRMTLKVTTPENMVNWVLSFGDSARVMKPDLLINAVKKKLSTISGYYGGRDSGQL